MNFSFFFGFYFISIVVFFVGVFTFVVQRYHFLMSLLSLEFMVIGLFLLIFRSCYESGSSYLVFVFLSFGSCEAALGLGLLVSLVRSHGSDFVSIVGIFEC
uniref:NADH-ubiquinone oxidoreductase chain 4L n=1 Tax=Nipponnemertes punctatula TaxID=1332184 RepID=X2CBV1_9BILA|nr:NADH dehydrogenase subunit 4L [Nipponnemertes punctatula]AGL46764.1 NADH dehydrogenase subunit 4L [Nipponnemertes punctatula]